MASEAEKTARGLKNFALFFFTAIGFIASIATIATYLQGSPRSSLSVKVFPNQILIPKYVASYLSDDSSTRKYAKELMDEFCKGIDSNKLIGLSEDDLSRVIISGKSTAAIKTCRDAHVVEFVLRWNNQFSNSEGALLSYRVENIGTDIAKGIRLPSNDVNAVQLKKGDDYVEIKEIKDQGYYVIPDLNPHEKVDLYVWLVSGSLINNRDYPDTSLIPTITYAGSSVDVEYYRLVGPLLWSIGDLFKGIPWYFVTIIVIFASLLITGAVILIISVSVSIFKGKGVAGAFYTNSPEKPGPAKDMDISLHNASNVLTEG